MLTIYVTYEGSDRASVEGFYSEIKSNRIDELSRAEDGNVCYDYYWPAEVQNQLFLLEKWETKEAQQLHSQQPHFQRLGQLKQKYGIESTVKFE